MKYDVNIDALTLAELADLTEKGTGMARLVELLNKCVIGGVNHCKPSELRSITKAVGEALSEAINPKEAESA